MTKIKFKFIDLCLPSVKARLKVTGRGPGYKRVYVIETIVHWEN